MVTFKHGYSYVTYTGMHFIWQIAHCQLVLNSAENMLQLVPTDQTGYIDSIKPIYHETSRDTSMKFSSSGLFMNR